MDLKLTNLGDLKFALTFQKVYENLFGQLFVSAIVIPTFNYKYTPRKKIFWFEKNLFESNKFVHCYTVKEMFLWFKGISWFFFLFELKKCMSSQSHSTWIIHGWHSHCALRPQLAWLASLSVPRARDLIVALRAPFFLDLALRARSCALRIRLSLFLII